MAVPTLRSKLHGLLGLPLGALAIGLGLIALLVMFGWAAFGPAPVQEDGIRLIKQAEFAALPEGTWTPVELPDTWSHRQATTLERGYYRVRVPPLPRQGRVLAIEFERLPIAHEVYVNGHLVDGTLERKSQQRRPHPILLTVPPAMWRDGENLIEIVCDGGARAGMSAIRLGDLAAVEQHFLRRQMTGVILPQALNAAAAGLSLFALLTWWQRRRSGTEEALAYFAAIGLLASSRNLAYVIGQSQVPRFASDWVMFLLQVFTALWLVLFCLSYADEKAPRLRTVLKVLGLGAIPLSMVMAHFGWLDLLRQFFYPVLMSVIAVGLAVLVRLALVRRRGLDVALVVSVALLLAVGVHDYLFQMGRTSVMDSFWLVYAVPVFILVFSMALLRRVANALGQVEHLNLVLERRVAERTQDLEQATLAKDRFLAAASHDLRQPMLSIGLLVALLKAQGVQPAAQGLLARLQGAVVDMERMFKQLLDFSRLEAAHVRVEPRPCSLTQLFDAIERHHLELAQRKGLRLRIRAGSRWVMADPVLLEQLVRNLVANAVRYTGSGSVLLAARRGAHGHVRIEVRDSGPGIPADQQVSIFAEFTQYVRHTQAGAGGALHPADPHAAPGIGLGLAIARRCASLLGTRLELKSEPGRGSCFSIVLPLVAPVAASLPPAPDMSPEVSLQDTEVWVVEDHAEVRRALHALLVQWQAQVSSFASAADLQQHMEQTPAAAPRLLVTDHHLPDERGAELIQRLRLRWPGLAAVIMTADTRKETLQALAEVAAEGVQTLHKPFNAESLSQVIAKALAASTPGAPRQ